MVSLKKSDGRADRDRRSCYPAAEPRPHSKQLLYCRAVAIALNLADRLVPTRLIAPMITTDISPAISPYSMAVAPDLSRRNRLRKLCIGNLLIDGAGYFSAVAIALNLPDRLVPTDVTAVMITTEISAAIRPYSMAVAPDW